MTNLLALKRSISNLIDHHAMAILVSVALYPGMPLPRRLVTWRTAWLACGSYGRRLQTKGNVRFDKVQRLIVSRKFCFESQLLDALIVTIDRIAEKVVWTSVQVCRPKANAYARGPA
jgi:hypothetical protein